MAAKSIVEVEVNSSQFDAFYALFRKYQKQLDEMPEGWEKVAGVADSERDDVWTAYNHAQYLAERRRMMQWWGDYLARAANA